MSSDIDKQGEEFLRRLTRLRKFSAYGKTAIHKPVLILYALSELAHRQAETIHYRAAETVVAPILVKFGPAGSRARVADPFARLESDGIWKIRATNREELFDASGNARPGLLNRYDVEAGFSEDILALLQSRPPLITAAVRAVVDAHIPSAIQSLVLGAVGWGSLA
jgi:putative restriction endonuclease